MISRITGCVLLPLVGFLLLMVSMESESYRILMIPLQQRSHLFSLKLVAEELMTRGHRVHFLINDLLPKSEILSPDTEQFHAVPYHGKIASFMAPNSSHDEMLEAMVRMSIERVSHHEMLKMATEQMQTECRQVLLNSEDAIKPLENEKFDIAVVDGSFLTHCFYLLPFRLHIPWVTYTDLLEPRHVPVPWLPSFVPSSLGALTESMNFKQRIQNTLMELFMLSGFLKIELPVEIDHAYRQYGHFNPLEDLIGQSRLFMSTRDSVLEYARPTMPNIINIGGLTARPAKNLSENLQDFLNGSRNGAILVTFGTMMKHLPIVMTEKLVSAFRRLEGYRVLWKFVNTDNLTIPANVRLEKWVPQQDILGHPRTKLFITHCGNNGQYESVYHGVPMIGLPLHSDEPYNAKRIEYRGYGIAMDIHDFTSDDLYNNIIKVLTDPSYKDRVSLASEIFRSAPQRPAERAAFWIEHVIKFGADQLQPAGKDLNIFQYFLLDVLATFVFIVIGSMFLVWKFWFLTCGKLVKRRRSEHLKTN